MAKLELMRLDANRLLRGVALVHNVHRHSIGVETLPSCLKDCRTLHRCVDCCDAAIVVIFGLGLAGIDIAAGVDEVLEALDTVARLSSEHAVRWCIFHEQGVHGGEISIVHGNGAASMGLVNIDLSAASHVKETLLRVNIGLGSDPTGGVEGTSQGLIVEILPLHCEGDGILGIDAPSLGNARRCSRRDANWTGDPRKGPFREVNVM
mmetsp:Transcript_5613/g.15764  ORF Transcript_5613/g.15764 Transcript_5613/m.15764 type:complete len:207 (+) Transcript_5613:54-674(+)